MDLNDKYVMDRISPLLNENDILVDVGANYGDYTHFFLQKLNTTGKIYSIELHPDTFNFLKNRFLSNNNVLFYNNAICDKNELIDFYSGNDSCTNNIIGHDMSFRPNNKIGQIMGITLDELLKSENNIKLIKVDVEGAELLVLKGMVNMIDKISYLLIECHLDENWGEIKTFLLKHFICENAITSEVLTLSMFV